MRLLQTATAVLCSLATFSHAFNRDLRIGSGGRNLNDLRKYAEEVEAVEAAHRKYDGFPTQHIRLPVDHFHNESRYAPHSNETFANRYWFEAKHYKPGGPVVLLLVGEASGTLRLPILQDGIAAQFIKENNGIGVVMEHRYYGGSFPTPNLSIENLRFLTTQQALADCAYLAQNIQFPGLEKYGDLTSKSVPWITYGGSYSGAMSAFLRVQYPEVFWGSISSSGVVEAIYDYWEYYEPVAQYAPQDCVAATQLFTHMVDNIYDTGNSSLKTQLQKVFNLPNVTHFNDFANQLSYGVGNWQSLIWDPAISYDGFYWYCGNITSHNVLFPHTKSKRSEAKALLRAGGYAPNSTITNQMLNYIGWNTETYITPCAEEGLTQNECFTTHNQTFYNLDDREQFYWRSWAYQYCSQWGFLQTGSGVPSDQLPLISRQITLPYTTIVCRDAFNITSPPDVDLSLQYGGYNIAYDRLAIIDGEWDPWRPATPHAFGYGAKNRTSTTNEPFILIADAIHHWDEYGVPRKEYTSTFPPQPIQQTQSTEHAFVAAWLAEWKKEKGNSTASK